MSASVQNMEEAATIASEFVFSLDNLPSEVQHLLQEIKHKESRSQDIQHEIAKESAKYIRHSLRVPSPSAAGSPASTPGPNPKSHLPPKIATSYTEIDRLAEEKQQLAQRIVDLVTRTKARLEADLCKVGVLQGEIVDGAKSGVGTPVSGEGYAVNGRNPVVQITESLRNALNSGGGEGLGAVMPVSGGGPGAQKKRRLTTQNSIKLPSPVPPPVSAPGYARSRLSRQIHPPRAADEELDADAEGEDDAEGEEGEDGDGEDKGIYCFCQKLSFGEMIACDNKDCSYQWFHLSCVNLKQPLPENWYCSNDCRVKGGIRKGRKK